MRTMTEEAIKEAHELADSIYDVLSRKMYIGNLHAAIDRLVVLVRLEQAERCLALIDIRKVGGASSYNESLNKLIAERDRLRKETGE